MKKIVIGFFVILAAAVLVGCTGSKEGLNLITKYNAREISTWGYSVTPGDDSKGKVEYNEDGDFATIQVDTDTWGGIQSPVVTLDFSKELFLAIQIKEVSDDYKWAIKFVPTTPIDEAHEWGFYIFEDNQAKYNKYLMANLNEQISKDMTDAYSGKIEGVFWLWASGGAEANFEVREMMILEGNFK